MIQTRKSFMELLELECWTGIQSIQDCRLQMRTLD